MKGGSPASTRVYLMAAQGSDPDEKETEVGLGQGNFDFCVCDTTNGAFGSWG